MVEETAGLASRVTRRLRKREWTISTAESCTGGLLASLITDISGASEWFKQGWVVYSNESKMRELGVEKAAFDEGEAGAVSHEVAVQMARGARYQSDSDVAISITGIAGPGGATAEKEVGRVHVAVVTGDYFLVRRMDFGENDRLDNKRSFAAFALRLALEALDRVVEVEERASKATINEEEPSSIDTSEFDPSDEEWEGSMSWKGSKKTVAEEISKVDLASLTDWDE
ncbi:MAG: CinA family protein [Candidatus Thalassarchaeum sp.]|uniref:CinA family protein n=1 Tax=Candidatus Thalassarchaeum betae TaxID=2599289 RepID=UPI00235BB44E|nr:CinA family protein [Candidatus Thalassoarchaea betae]MCK5868166.1 CinA family protein [Candidatus Thalassarchaeum sp.]MDP7531420.1 CinA family protein [Candidatus Thalassarchaeum sp.]